MDHSGEICTILDRIEERHARLENRVMETKERIRKILDDISMKLEYIEGIMRNGPGRLNQAPLIRKSLKSPHRA